MKYVSDAVVNRLPVYHRYLKQLMKEGVHQISSRELSEHTGFSSSQIRQDINSVGGSGRQGLGYRVETLDRHIENLMGLDTKQDMVIIGAGNIGRAIVRNDAFAEVGFSVSGVFDADERVIGKIVGKHKVRDVAGLKAFLEENPADIGVLAVPVWAAQEMADLLVECGVRGILNFAPVDLKLPRGISLEAVHLENELEVLSYRMLRAAEERN